MVVGSEPGQMRLYGDIENVFDGTFTLLAENYGNIKDGGRTVPALADLDQDGFYEMVLGNKRGGVTLYDTDLEVMSTAIGDTPSKIAVPRLYPNPAFDNVYLNFGGMLSGQVARVEIWDAMGRLLLTRENCSNGDAIQLPTYSGVAVALITVASEMTIQKLLFLN
jgi:hypothetical protein